MPVLVAKRRQNGRFDDHYHHLHLSDLKPGPHTAHALVRVLGTKKELSKDLMFSV
jgi:hypothetical protein